MSRSLTRCAKCNKLKYESEVRFDSILKDYTCKNETNCSNQNSKQQLSKVRGRRMGTIKHPTFKNNMQ